MQRDNSLEKTLILGKIKGKRRRVWQRMRCLDGITDSMDMYLSIFRTSLVAQMVKCLSTMRETWVRSLGWKDLEKEMATHSSVLAWEIHMDRGA